MTQRFRSILITGASGGIGAALARFYAAPGIRLCLGGRDAARLAAIARDCATAGAETATRVIDVTDAKAMRDWVQREDDVRSLDLVVASAGILGEAAVSGNDPVRAREIYSVNVLGTLNTIEPLLPRFRTRRAGQVALLASLAGFRGIARWPAYCGSKAALIAHGEGWRSALAPHGVGVSVVCPGYVRTAMVASNSFEMPFLIEPEQAARRIAHGLARNQARILFPWPLTVAAWLFRVFPEPWTRMLIPGSRAGVA